MQNGCNFYQNKNDNLNCYKPLSGVINPFLIKKSMTTGALVVLKSGDSNISIDSSIVNSSKRCTSPSELSGTKSIGNSIS